MEIPVEMGFFIFMLLVWYLYSVHSSRKLRSLEELWRKERGKSEAWPPAV